MKKTLLIIGTVIAVLFALLQLLAMISSNGLAEQLARGVFAGGILLALAIVYQRRNRTTDKDQ